MRVEVLQRIDEVAPRQWDALAGERDPFVEHGFLDCLERSGSVGEDVGWRPCHVVVRDEGGDPRGALPLYLKDHSFGEYIFDWGWAEAAHAAGVPYYPKLVSAVPFTPVTGRRLLLRADEPDAGAVRAALVAGARRLAREADASSMHVLFLRRDEQADLALDGDFVPRLSYQFHWTNAGYRDFDDYLASFRSSARKSVRRERRRAAAAGLTLRTLDGPELNDEQWGALYRCYRHTSARKWGQAYLTREFFELVRERLAHRVVVTLAADGDRTVAAALSLHKGGRLYGRHWGAVVPEVDALHFELCYYRPLELCIERGWSRFEAGAQGIHKLRRGLLPALTYSAHWIAHPALRQAVARFVRREAAAVERECAALARHGPFRRDDSARPGGRGQAASAAPNTKTS